MEHYLAFDIGGTAVKHGLVDGEGNVLQSGSFPTPAEGPALLGNMRRVYETYAAAFPVSGVAVSSPGAVDCDRKISRGLSAVGYIQDAPLGQELSRLLDGLPVEMENDGNCAGLGEVWTGAAREKNDIVCITCGSGIGGAIIKNRRVHKGASNNGGEFGYFLMPGLLPNQMWFWNDFAPVHIVQRYNQDQNRALNGKQLAELAREGDPTAVRYMEEVYFHIAWGCVNIHALYDPELILLGGAISNDHDILPKVQRYVDQWLQEKHAFLKPTIQVCQHRSNANLIGAVYHFLIRRAENTH